MKKIFLQFITLSALAISVKAQNISVGAQYSSLTGHGKNDNHSTLSGATVFGAYSITSNMSVGAVIHAYAPKKHAYTNGNFSYNATDDVTNVAISYEMKMPGISELVQPFIGADMGISTSNHKVEFYNDMKHLQKLNLKQTYVMISPKVGVNIPINKTFGVYTQAQYNFCPGDGGKTVVAVKNSKSNAVITTEPISKYFNVDGGIYMLIGNIKKIM